jgi:hypothetical protein
MTAYYVAEAALNGGPLEAEGDLVDVNGERFFRIVNHDAMAPFLMSLVSDSDLWMFVSSTGALTAGRRDANTALFPYYTDDRIHDSQDVTGAKSIFKVTRHGRTSLWQPFSPAHAGLYRITRSLSKSVYNNKLVFEEVNHDLGLSFSSGWMNSDRFGFVRRASLRNLGVDEVGIELLDGIQNLLPSGLTQRFQLEYSTLADGYKESELHAGTGLGLFRLSSIPADQPRPREALRTTAVWCEGLGPVRHLLCAAQLDRFRRGLPLSEETLIRGRRGAYFVQTEIVLTANACKEWSLVADVGQDAAAVAATVALLKSGKDLRASVDEDIARGTQNLVRIVAGADGLQMTGDERNVWRHFSNVLFNTMRGGIPDRGYVISRSDFKAFVSKASRTVARNQAKFLDQLPETLLHEDLITAAEKQRDPDLERLAHEYLPLTFSRRHGDPSRPWNVFSIEVKGEHGEKILNYQGNWRDIFQNWEALALSYPGYVEGMIFKFLCASTADGYNPFRIARNGFDWEVQDAHDTWSYIGYWGDHQVGYLPQLLDIAARHRPGVLTSLLTRRLFTYANVPYRIKPYKEMLSDPHNTIVFDDALDRDIRRRAAEMGTDGKTLQGSDNAPYRVNLTEKLLVLILARFFNFVPEAGLWMNTQRPEWNDANNGLVGNGVSMVTLCYMRRMLSLTRRLFAEAGTRKIEISAPVADAFRRVSDILERHASLLRGTFSDRDRKTVLDALGEAGSDYRAALYKSGFSGHQKPLAVTDLVAFCDVATRHVDHAIRANRREDGLYHAYNLLQFAKQGIAIRRLQEMLEGQVAVLSSGALSAHAASELLDALRRSKLYRADQNSYMLYPDKKLPSFFEKNNIPAASLAKSKTLLDMIARDDRRIVVRDLNGAAHFNAAFSNTALLQNALVPLGLPQEEFARILELYEEVFHHQTFTGRSGAFYKYEGLGCIYWHMVSKLLLEVQRTVGRSIASGEGFTTVDRLQKQYHDIREGIGTHKSPAVYGAMPIDPYSHTPGFAGVQQPGMTGQVKEDIISRFGEMGVVVNDARLNFAVQMAGRGEFLTKKTLFHFYDVDGREQSLDLEPGTLAFTVCQVPIVLRAAGAAQIEIAAGDGSRRRSEGLSLDAETSSSIFRRTGAVRQLDVYLGLGALGSSS